MTQTGYSNAIVDAMLGWLKGLASWVLRLFNLSGGFSPLKFLANNWLELLVFFLILGVAIDLLVWLIRWRPHWVWFRKKRVIINDKNFFAQEKYIDDSDDWDLEPRKAAAAGRAVRPRRNWEDSEFIVPSAARRRREEQELRRLQQQENTDVFLDEFFNVNAKQKYSDKYEDEVFSVSNLPTPERGERSAQAARRRPVRSVQRGRNTVVKRKR